LAALRCWSTELPPAAPAGVPADGTFDDDDGGTVSVAEGMRVEDEPGRMIFEPPDGLITAERGRGGGCGVDWPGDG
jgi:hypothetical protein